MIRQRQRKTIEELYGNKFEAPKSQVSTSYQNGGQKTGRTTERDYSFMINSNNAYNGLTQPPLAATSTAPKAVNTGRETARRKTARPLNKIPYAMEEDRRSPSQPAKNEKVNHITNVYDNKTFGKFKDPSAEEHHQHHHHHNHNHHTHTDEDKDDDTDEFFELIRRTVDTAIGKSISELLNRNFRELSSKVDRFSSELKNTNTILNQLQNDLTNRINHYGEENSRHFRYLCMKSEYDKMFYQHQTLIATAKAPTAEVAPEPKKTERRKISPKNSKISSKVPRVEGDKQNSPVPCPCRSARNKTPTTELKEPHQCSSGDISQKSSEVGMREVLEHIQKFCSQVQFNDYKPEQNCDGPGTSQQRNILLHDDMLKINKEIFVEDDEDDEDDAEWEISSECITPRNRSSDKYGGNTKRGNITHRGNNGAGDA